MDVVRTRLGAGTDQYQELVSWVARRAASQASLLDIGAGKGRNPYLADLVGRCTTGRGGRPQRRHRRQPVPHSPPQGLPGLRRGRARASSRSTPRWRCTWSSTSTTPPPSSTPPTASCVPGGSLYLLTPNLWHYFGLASLVASRLHLDDWLLKRLRGRKLVDDYHFDVQFQMNSVHQLTEAAERAGFARSSSATSRTRASSRATSRAGSVGSHAPTPRWCAACGAARNYGTLLVQAHHDA